MIFVIFGLMLHCTFAREQPMDIQEKERLRLLEVDAALRELNTAPTAHKLSSQATAPTAHKLSSQETATAEEFRSVVPPDYLREQGVPLPSYSETPKTMWQAMDREYASLGLETAVGSGGDCTGSSCDFSCALSNQRLQEGQHPHYNYPSTNGETARSNGLQALTSNWEPILESVPGCNGLGQGSLQEIPVLVVLDKSWVDYYNSNPGYFHTQKYYSLNDSPKLLFDRVNYLFEKQFGIRFKIGRVEAISDLVDACASNDGYAEIESIPATLTKSALKRRGITSSAGIEGGIIRFGAGGMTPGVYCHSYAGVGGVCEGSGTVDSLPLMLNMVVPFNWGYLNHRAAVTLAHELAHWFNVCSSGSDCIHAHTSNNLIDIMVWNGIPASDMRSQGMMFKFLVTCTNVYRDQLCVKARSLPASCRRTVKPDPSRQCPAERFPWSTDAAECWSSDGRWCSNWRFRKSEWGYWICQNCPSCRARGGTWGNSEQTERLKEVNAALKEAAQALDSELK